MKVMCEFNIDLQNANKYTALTNIVNDQAAAAAAIIISLNIHSPATDVKVQNKIGHLLRLHQYLPHIGSFNNGVVIIVR